MEPLVAVLKPDVNARSLGEWMAALHVLCWVRHLAAANTLATAELLKLCHALKTELKIELKTERPPMGFRAVQRLADQRRGLPP